jgi:hypothetical protein
MPLGACHVGSSWCALCCNALCSSAYTRCCRHTGQGGARGARARQRSMPLTQVKVRAAWGAACDDAEECTLVSTRARARACDLKQT